MNLFSSHYSDFDSEGFINNLKDIITDETIIVNIGTDRNIGDSISPLVGTLLKENNFPLPVYGTIESPIHAKNLEYNIVKIKEKHPNANIIALDAMLGNEDNIGDIKIRDVPINPGKGVGKNLTSIGDYSIAMIISDSDDEALFAFRSIRLDFILKIAKTVANGLIKATQYIDKTEIAIDNTYNKDNEEIKLYKCC